MKTSSYYLSVHVTVLHPTEAEATARVGRPEDPLFGTFRSRFSATGEPATIPVLLMIPRCLISRA